jgi:hypothetical protein
MATVKMAMSGGVMHFSTWSQPLPLLEEATCTKSRGERDRLSASKAEQERTHDKAWQLIMWPLLF